MSQFLTLRALLFAGDCFAASVLLLGTAAIANRFLRQASLRHLVWLTAFGTMLVLPIAALLVPPQLAIHRSVQTQFATVDSLPFSSAARVPMLPPAPSPSWHIGTSDLMLALSLLWLIGFGWIALRLLIGAIGINALHMSSRRMDEQTRRAPADLQGCDLRVADDQSGPMTWGTLRPVILLPNEAPGWPPERLRAVLLHELAHVRRRDSLAQTLSRIACALYWPNPLAWIAARAMRREAEMAADDAVIEAGVRPSVYADELLRIAAVYHGAHGVAGAGLSMAAKCALEARVKSILGTDKPRRGVTHMDIAKIAGAGLLAAAAFGFVRPSLAEDAPPVPPAPPSAASIAAAPAPAVAPLPVVAPVAAVVVAQNDPPPPPPAPDAPPPPPAPDAPPAPPSLAVPPTPPNADYAIDMHGGHTAMRHLTPEERRKLHGILHNLHHEIHDAMAKARPEMRRALADLQAHREELKAMQPQIEQAMREARPQIEHAMEEARKAVADAKIDEHVRRHIEKAMRHVEAHMDAMHDDGRSDGDVNQGVIRDHQMHDMDEEDSDQDNDHDDDQDNDDR
jgi:beta-lactamase regulating signal transducer with metallopeptidase domain